MAEIRVMGIIPTKIVLNSLQLGDLIDKETLRPQPENDIILICGDATGVFDDMEAFFNFGIPSDIMLINYLPMAWKGPYQHYVAGDSHMADMQKVVADHVPGRVVKHCWNPNSKGFDVRWIKENKSGWNGTTANLAIKVALTLDYTRIILAGVPMDKSGNWYKPYIPDNDTKQNKDHTAHLWKWTELACRPIASLIRSMSGNTQDLFGRPTLEWLLKHQTYGRKEHGRRKRERNTAYHGPESCNNPGRLTAANG